MERRDKRNEREGKGNQDSYRSLAGLREEKGVKKRDFNIISTVENVYLSWNKIRTDGGRRRGQRAKLINLNKNSRRNIDNDFLFNEIGSCNNNYDNRN